jgi:hypothetical protein
MAKVAYPRFGELIDQLVRALAGIQNWRLGRTVAEVAQQTGYSEAAVYRWRQGRLCPPEEIVQQLGWMGQQQAQLARVWGESMLRAARYDDVTSLVNEIWGAQVIRTIPSNLPPPAYTRFVGRAAD